MLDAQDRLDIEQSNTPAPIKPELVPGLIAPETYVSHTQRLDPTIADEILAYDKAQQSNTILGNIGDAFQDGSNIGVQVYQSLRDNFDAGSPDPDWSDDKKKSWIDAQVDIPVDQQWRYYATNNMQHAQNVYDTATTNRKKAQELSIRSGMSPLLAQIGVSLVDIDMPLAIFGGAAAKGARILTQASKAKTLFNTTALSRTARGAATGGALLTGLGAIDFAADPNSEWTVIPTLGVLGFGLGAVVPGMAGVAQKMTDVANKGADEIADVAAMGTPKPKVYAGRDDFGIVAQRQAEIREYEEKLANPPETAEGVEPVEPRMPEHFAIDQIDDPRLPDNYSDTHANKGSIGAQQLNRPVEGIGVDNINNPHVQQRIRNAEAELQQLGTEADWFADPIKLEQRWGLAGKAGARLHDAITAVLPSNFKSLFTSNSAIAKVLATKLFTDPTGIARNAVDAADNIMREYETQIFSTLLPYHQNFYVWRQAMYPNSNVWNNIKQLRKHQDEYAKEVILEAQARKYSPGTPSTAPKYIQDAADAHDRFHAVDLKLGKGLPGEQHRTGYDVLTETRGYAAQNINPNKYIKVFTDLNARYGNRAAQMMRDMLSQAMRATNPSMAQKDADIYASAMDSIARSKDAGVSINLVGMLKEGGRERLYRTLIANNVSQGDANRLIDNLIGEAAERGRAGHTKGRIDIDMRMTINGVKMIDLFDTNLIQHYSRRGRQAAGMSALARIGIPDRTAMAQLWEDIKLEQQAKGRPAVGASIREKAEDFVDGPTELSEKDFNDMFSYFTGDPIAGGMSPLYSNIRKITGLSLLNQLGLTSVAEFGPLWAAYGFANFFEALPPAIRMAMKDKGSPLIEELYKFDTLTPQERLMPDAGNYELDKLNATDMQDFQQTLSHGLTNALHVQAQWSGFNFVRRVHQNMAAHLMTARLFEGMNGKVVSTTRPFSPERLADLGIVRPNDVARITRMARSAGKFDADGRLVDMDLSQWTDQDLQWYKRILYAGVDKYVHLARAGETSYWFHRDGLGSLFFHLKSFPLTAMSKQAYRNARIGDTETIHAFLAGLATSGMVYTAKQVINGNDQNLTPYKIGMGAVNYSNFTGWLPMWSSPILALAGADVDNGRGPLSMVTPAAFSTVQRLSEIPGIPADVLTSGELTNSNIRALQALPIVGNIYGAPLIWNALKH